MNDGISKNRIRRIARLRRQRLARRSGAVPFKNGTPLAMLYLAAVVAVSLAVSFLADGTIGAPTPGVPILHTLVSDIAVMCCAVACGRLMLGRLAPEILDRNSRILMLGIVAVASDLLCVATLRFGCETLLSAIGPERLPEDVGTCRQVAAMLLPCSFAPALATLLAGVGAGVSLGVAMAVQNVLFVPPQAGLAAALGGLFAAVAAPVAVSDAHRRGPIARRLAALGLVQVFATFFAVWAAPEFGGRLFAGTCSGASSGGEAASRLFRAFVLTAGIPLLAAPFSTLALLPVLERLFAACSAVALDRWADLSTPLLRRLSLEAPGTFHHSLMVANLAEAAAEAVGADPLLARVGGYYHDIGKLSAPEKFTENIGFGGVNPHDGLAPAMSALILAAHVRDGMAMADAEKLPAPVRAIIAEHHGTSSMAFFLDKARKLAAAKEGGADEPVDENRYRYSGPRPATAESAIVMLADSVEAASRSLANPDPQILEKKVDAVVSGKIRDGQLDDSPLSFSDAVEIRRTFSSLLATALHGRISYPGDKGAKASGESDGQKENGDSDAAARRGGTDRQPAQTPAG